MNNAMTPFQFEAATVRVINRDNEPWFVAKDVCDVLDIKNPTVAVRNLDDDELDYENLSSGMQSRKTTLVSESGLYALIMRSNKPQAKAFRKWVTSEVLPAIRKHGMYMTDNVVEQVLNNPESFAGVLDGYIKERKMRIEAERTKAHISRKREATAMATASAEKRKRLALEDRLGEGKRWTTVVGIPWWKEFFREKHKGAYTKVGQTLAAMSKELGYPIRKVDTMQGERNAYHVDVTTALYNKLKSDPSHLKNWRSE